MCTYVHYHTLSHTIVHGGTLEYAFRRRIVAFAIVIPHTQDHPILSIIHFAILYVSNTHNKAVFPVKYRLFSKIIEKKFCQTVFFLVLCKTKCALGIFRHNLNALTGETTKPVYMAASDLNTHPHHTKANYKTYTFLIRQEQ